MKYRSEVDGLRALAVIPVILFHAGFEIFKGGFVGVDIFFVISGYLITTIILSEKEAGTFSLANFYERRARRILPALFLVMLVCLPFAWLWLMPEDMIAFMNSLKWVAIFSSNVFFNRNGYFQTISELKPLLHTWSLAVEEQYYVFFPALVMLAWRFGKRFLLVLFGLIFLISLSYTQYKIGVNASASFFLLPSRIWEILLGAFVAFYFSMNINKHEAGHYHLSLLGLALIIFAIFCFDKQTPYPSLYTLVPTLGAVLIIVYANASNMVGRLLGHRFFVGVGLISYSAYLWHQPIFAFARYRSLEAPSTQLMVLLAALALVLGFFSWKFVETPFRKKEFLTRRVIFTLSLLGILFFVGMGFLGRQQSGFISRFPVEAADYVNIVEFNWAKHTRTDICNLGDEMTTEHPAVCFEEKRPLVAVWGDSHAAAIYPGLKHLQDSQNFGLIQLNAGACPPIFNLEKLGFRKNCNEVNAQNLKYLQAAQPDIVLIHAAWRHADYPMTNAELASKVESTIVRVRETLPSARVVVIGPVPRWSVSPQSSSYHYWLDHQGSSVKPDRLKAEKLVDIDRILEDITQRHGAEFISAISVLCSEAGCLAKVGPQPEDFIAVDYGHLSKAGSEYFISEIKEKILKKPKAN